MPESPPDLPTAVQHLEAEIQRRAADIADRVASNRSATRSRQGDWTPTFLLEQRFHRLRGMVDAYALVSGQDIDTDSSDCVVLGHDLPALFASISSSG
jgi:hypothetical protein